MIVERKPGVMLAHHPDGRVGVVRHPKTTSTELVYVHLGGPSRLAYANWPRNILTFRFVRTEMQDESAGQPRTSNAH